MEKIKVSNFLTLEDIELEIKPINIVIGEQAQGKSVLAKLIYFFKSFWRYYRDSIFNNQSEKEFRVRLIKNFTEIFPKYTWHQDIFRIEYILNDYEISIRQEALEIQNNRVCFDYSHYLSNTREDIRKSIHLKTQGKNQRNNNKIQSFININNLSTIEDSILSLVLEPIDTKGDMSSFIPASRSFFSSMKNNIFSILSKDINIDRLMKDFGSLYENFKEDYLAIFEELFEGHYSENKNIHDIKEIVNKIIGGKFTRRSDGEDVIQYLCKNGTREIKIVNASSGQQESLPIVVILSALYTQEQNFFLVIEEPEAHLFPEAQKYMVELMSLIFNLTRKRNKLFITTHSPYLLTAFNHSIQAGNVLKAINDKPPEEAKKLQKELFKIMPHNQILDIEDIGVYSLTNGKITNIIEQENNLIDTNIIDEVSELFGKEFDELLDLESKVCQWH